MRYQYLSVDRIPKELHEGVVYHSREFELACLLCACGCGHRVTLLVPDSHQVFDQNGLATIRPSIGVLDAPCKSHYVISGGQVDWLPALTGRAAGSIMQAQIARHVARDPKPSTWLSRLHSAWNKSVAKLKRFFSAR